MPQQKKTAPIEHAELPDLSEADQEFARLVALGKGTLSDAFRQTRDTSNYQPKTVWAEASRLRSSPKVGAWVDAFRAAGLGAAGYTLERHVAELERLKALSVKSGNMGAALGCEQTIGKASGLHVERYEDMTQRDNDPFDTLRNIARDLGDDIARQAAAKAGIPWPLPPRADQPAADTRH